VLGAEVPVSGLSVAGLAVLMARFRQVSDYLSGRPVDLDAATLLSLGPDVVAAIIACGTGGVRLTPQCASIDPAEEAAAAALPLEAQADLLEAILSRTFPRGVPDFFGAHHSARASGRPRDGRGTGERGADVFDISGAGWSKGRPSNLAQDLAHACVTLIERGHDRTSISLSTPRQMAALLRASDRAHSRRLADSISTGRLAYHGKDNAVRDPVRRRDKGG
jgi:hypothetical protein